MREKIKDLREACVQETLAIIETSGLESLSLREISRRLGVSHQAPYKHFPSRDHILAEVVKRAFDAFAEYLDSHAGDKTTEADMLAMGQAYLVFAQAHPLQYRLMFNTPLPNPAEHPEMMKSAQHAFYNLRDCLGNMPTHQDASPDQLTLDALFVWSSMHGLASILNMQSVAPLNFSETLHQQMIQHLFYRIGAALNLPRP
jgi:AcrR family transcriptional regulator